MTATADDLPTTVVGAGDPILLVPGSGSGPDSWTAVAAALAGEFEVWSFVRRAYTGRPGPTPRTFADEVADVRGVLAAVGRPAHLVGASLGATLALHTALRSPEGIRSLGLFEPPLLLAGPQVGPVAARHRDLVAAGEADLAQLADDDRDVARWSAITLPTVILQGGQTWSPVPEGVEALAGALPHAERVVWPDESHVVTATAPGRFADAVADFARRH